MFYPEGNAPDVQSTTAVIDTATGVALDAPLGKQIVPLWWKNNPEELARVLALRQKYGIVVKDDYLTVVDTSGVDDGPPPNMDYIPDERYGLAPGEEPRPKKAMVIKKRGDQVTPRNVKIAKNGNKGGRGAKSAAMSRANDLYTGLDVKGTPGVVPAQLRKYWLGEGLSRWATTPTPYRSLVAALRKEGVPVMMINGLAARLYRSHFGKWPGKDKGE